MKYFETTKQHRTLCRPHITHT